MSTEIQEIMANMQPTFTFIYELLIKFWNIVQIIIGTLVYYKPFICKFTLKATNIILFVYNFMWKFTETIFDKELDDSGFNDNIEPISPKKPLIDKSWCDIDKNNIIEDQDKSKTD